MDIYLQGMRDRSRQSGTELVREIKLTDWSTAETCLTGPLGYKYRVMFVLVHVLSVICTNGNLAFAYNAKDGTEFLYHFTTLALLQCVKPYS